MLPGTEAFTIADRGRLWDTSLLLMNSSTSCIHLSMLRAYESRVTGEFLFFSCPLSVQLGAISQPSLARRHPSDIRGMTWPSEGDDVMNEAGWQHKVKVVTLSCRAIADRFSAQPRVLALGMQDKVKLSAIRMQ